MTSSHLIASLLIFLNIFYVPAHAANATSAKVCNVHVFVHGTYGSFFSLLSYPFVKKDNLKGTTYVAVQRLMRETQLVRYRRFSSSAGLSEVSPGTQLPENEPARYVVGTFAAIQRQVSPNDKDSHRYFMFGWSGLLSQQERRREAIRLYTELVALVDRIRADGCEPVLNLYGHSHGANVILNLGLVDRCSFDIDATHSVDLDAKKNMQKLLAGGAVSDLAYLLDKDAFEKAKKWYIRPPIRLKNIKRIVLFGVPVQEETAPLVLSSLFENVLHIYSDNDGVAAADGISSKHKSTNNLDLALVAGHPSIKTIRWMNCRTPLDECTQCANQPSVQNQSRLGFLKNLTKERFKRLKGTGNPDSHHPLDPTHADFWAIGNKRDGAFFEQVPLLVYMPLIYKLLPSVGSAQQLDFSLVHQGENAIGFLFFQEQEGIPNLARWMSISLKPVVWARAGIEKILDVRKKLEINLKIQSPFFKKR